MNIAVFGVVLFIFEHWNFNLFSVLTYLNHPKRFLDFWLNFDGHMYLGWALNLFTSPGNCGFHTMMICVFSLKVNVRNFVLVDFHLHIRFAHFAASSNGVAVARHIILAVALHLVHITSHTSFHSTARFVADDLLHIEYWVLFHTFCLVSHFGDPVTR